MREACAGRVGNAADESSAFHEVGQPAVAAVLRWLKTTSLIEIHHQIHDRGLQGRLWEFPVNR